MLKLFAVWDEKALAFGSPIACPTNGLALRAFADACADSRSPMVQYPGDYKLYELGTYDPNTGRVESLDRPVLLTTASAVVSQLRVARGEKIEVVEEVLK